jgi:hypothetical protein
MWKLFFKKAKVPSMWHRQEATPLKKIDEERGAQNLAFYKNSGTDASSIEDIAFVVQKRAARAVILSQTTNLPKSVHGY